MAGKFKVVMRAGRVKRDMYTDMTYAEAEAVCDDYGWEVAPDGDGGFVWDLEIDEDD